MISKRSNVQVIVVNNQMELNKYFKKNLVDDELVIGMGAGIISKWMRDLKLTLWV